MNAERHRPERVIALEVWDVMIAAQPLYLVPRRELPGAISRLVLQLREGTARRRRGALLPRLDIDSVVLGGGAPLTEIGSAIGQSGVPTHIFGDPLWIAESGGRSLWSRFGLAAPCAVLDVGQTSLKLSLDGRRHRLMRPMHEVPLELDVRDPSGAAQCRDRTLAFLASALARAAHARALVLGLPCEIADDLTLAGCSYPWPAGDASLVQELLHRAELDHIPCLVLNDAELAAVSVDLTRAKEESTLVLTIGLGVGGAYISRA